MFLYEVQFGTVRLQRRAEERLPMPPRVRLRNAVQVQRVCMLQSREVIGPNFGFMKRAAHSAPLVSPPTRKKERDHEKDDACTPLRAVEFAFQMPRIRMVMSWHERTEHDGGSSAFRELIRGALSA